MLINLARLNERELKIKKPGHGSHNNLDCSNLTYIINVISINSIYREIGMKNSPVILEYTDYKIGWISFSID